MICQCSYTSQNDTSHHIVVKVRQKDELTRLLQVTVVTHSVTTSKIQHMCLLFLALYLINKCHSGGQ